MITNCRSCYSEKLVDILSLGTQYLSDFINKGDPKPEKYPLNLVYCQNCTLVQLKDTVPAKSLYTDHYGYRSGINQTMRDHLREIVEDAKKRIGLLSPGDIVLDIGANDGTLLSNYSSKYVRVGFEPVKKLASECEKHAEVVVNDFFNYDAYNKNVHGKATIITAISMFYDLDDPNQFVEDIKNILYDEGIFVIQQNYLLGMIWKCAFDNVVHEHLEYYSLKSLEHLLNRHGLEIVDVGLNNINGGSFRTYIKHMDNVKSLRMLEIQKGIDKSELYNSFIQQVYKIKDQLRSLIEEENKKGKIIYVYGASTRGNTLLQFCGLDHTLIRAAVERNPDKWDKMIASVDIPIISEEQARKDKPDYMLVLPWFFKEEIIKREAEYLKNGGHLIIPLPEIEII